MTTAKFSFFSALLGIVLLLPLGVQAETSTVNTSNTGLSNVQGSRNPSYPEGLAGTFTSSITASNATITAGQSTDLTLTLTMPYMGTQSALGNAVRGCQYPVQQTDVGGNTESLGIWSIKLSGPGSGGGNLSMPRISSTCSGSVGYKTFSKTFTVTPSQSGTWTFLTTIDFGHWSAVGCVGWGCFPPILYYATEPLSVSTNITVNVASPAPTVSLTATPSSVNFGGSSTLSWSSTDATSCTGTNFSTGGATAGSVSTGPLVTTTLYSINCTGPGGTTSANATVTVAGGGGTCVVPAGSSTADGTTDEIIFTCGSSAGTGYYSPGDFIALNTTVLQTAPNDYVVCHDNSSIPYLTCAVGGGVGPDLFAWSGQSICNQSYPTCTPPPPANSLKVCQSSCSSGIQRGNTSSTQSFTIAQGGSQNLVACYNTASGCTDSTGDVTASATWGENAGSNVVSLSGSNPKVVTANTAGTEGISASYSGQTVNMNVNVTCVPTTTCQNANQGNNYCQNETYTIGDECGNTLTCNGRKSCDFNWKEVAP